MKAEALLALFERVADAPEAITRLRCFVRDLAVRGKLVEQDSANEPASARLDEARARLRVRAKDAKRMRWTDTNPVAPDEVGLPAGWAAARVNDTGLFINGLAFKPTDWKSSGLPIIRIQNLTDPTKDFNYAQGVFPDEVLVRDGDVLVSWSATLDAFKWSRGDGVLNQHIFRVLPEELLTVPDFLLLILRNAIREMGEGDHARGLVMTHINRGPFLNHIVRIPPLAEQCRIVAKVDELMALLDRLEAARSAREATRDRLTTASLTRVTAADTDPEALRTHARSTLDALPALTTRADQIRCLRQSIFDLAVRGRLLKQDAEDEPASELLRRLAEASSSELTETSQPRRGNRMESARAPFELPPSWKWCALGGLSRLITKGSSPKWQGVGYVQEDGLLFITSENVGHFKLRKLDELKYVEKRFKEIEPRSMLMKGDILINLVGASIGRTAIYDLEAEANINQAVALVRLIDPRSGPSLDYLTMYLNSAAAVELMLGSRVTTAQANISLGDVKEFPIPLPPFAEQHRIVVKVDELMSLCDRLEAALQSADTTRARLLEALLHEALASDTTESKAA